jgi:hypothetical protein
MKTKIEEIYDAVLPHLAANGFEDTTENRFYALTGLKDGWLEDEDRSLEKSFYLLAVTGELLMLKIKLMGAPKVRVAYVLDDKNVLHAADCDDLEEAKDRTYLTQEQADEALVAPTEARQHTCMYREEEK